MYKGDGSYKAVSYQTERSLMDLLLAEQEIVNRLNDAYRGYEIAKKEHMRTFDFTEDIRFLTPKLESIRKEIRGYFENAQDGIVE